MIKLVDILLRNGASATEADFHGHTPLGIATSIDIGPSEVFSRILEQVDVNQIDGKGRNSLHYACTSFSHRYFRLDVEKHRAKLVMLLERHANPTGEDAEGNTSIQLLNKNYSGDHSREIILLARYEDFYRDPRHNELPRVDDETLIKQATVLQRRNMRPPRRIIEN